MTLIVYLQKIMKNNIIFFWLPLAWASHSQLAVADYYQWYQGWNQQAPKYSSPAAACAADEAWDIFTPAGYKLLDASVGKCLQTANYNGAVHGPDDWYNHVIARIGDRCPDGTSYNSGNGECVSETGPEENGEPGISCEAESINFLSGNVFFAESDFSGSTSALGFGRSFNSLDGITRHNYSTRIQVVTAGLIRITNTGKTVLYSRYGDSLIAQSYDLGKLSKLASGWSYTTESNEVFTFDAVGNLVKRTSSGGQQEQITYSESTVTVTDQVGRTLTITEDAQHQPLTFSAPGVNIQYIYNTNNRLVQIFRTQAGVIQSRQYHYDDSRNNALLTGITDERGVLSENWVYDDQGRAIASQKANGARLSTVAYNNDGTRRVTNELGKSTLYHFIDVAGVKRVSAVEGEPSANCPSSNSTFTYNDRGQVLTKTDAKGFITTHTYNDRGLETSRTEASGTPQARTTTTTWHATFNLPLTVTEGGQVTTYTYDAQGRQTSRTQTAL